ncbi:hypothetical protein LCGC14_1240880 [marine sediment metagenome]|uniref:Uncharacterized protein n=1 Tax=marine sediment metagenome TaxID=412755 RepID=A0A0F9L9W6_9ZZZZ
MDLVRDQCADAAPRVLHVDRERLLDPPAVQVAALPITVEDAPARRDVQPDLSHGWCPSLPEAH